MMVVVALTLSGAVAAVGVGMAAVGVVGGMVVDVAAVSVAAVAAGSMGAVVRSLVVAGSIILAILAVTGKVVMAGRRVMVMVMGLALRLVISCLMALFALIRETLMNNGWMSCLGRWCQAGVRIMIHFLVIISFIIFGPFHFFLPPCLCPLVFLASD